MASRAPSPVALAAIPARLSDFVQLGKPRLSALVLVTAAGGMWLAPGHLAPVKAAIALAMTTLAVAAANALNAYLERDTDALMHRTRTRPLPAGRLEPRAALVFGVTLAAASVASLVFSVNPLCGALAAVAIVSYVAVYTPMKYQSPHAVIVGALPGAIPPLLGWTAVTGRIGPGGLALAAILFVWQLPHFLAIALYLKDDYARAGIRVLPLTHGDRATRACIALYSLLLVPVTLALPRLHVAGPKYFFAAAVLGAGFLGWSATGLQAGAGKRWARGLMLASVAYLTLLFAALALDVA